jgi:hypothetical protein
MFRCWNRAMDSTHDDLSIPAGMSYDRSFGADRHDLRTHPLGQEPDGLMSIAARAARRILRRTPDAPGNSAALSRVAAKPGNGRPATLRS